ncbi:Uncharacterised protein [Bordetella pertussis]|nr:Uncharacterised protein [Bordetella pertussis]
MSRRSTVARSARYPSVTAPDSMSRRTLARMAFTSTANARCGWVADCSISLTPKIEDKTTLYVQAPLSIQCTDLGAPRCVKTLPMAVRGRPRPSLRKLGPGPRSRCNW